MHCGFDGQVFVILCRKPFFALLERLDLQKPHQSKFHGQAHLKMRFFGFDFARLASGVALSFSPSHFTYTGAMCWKFDDAVI